MDGFDVCRLGDHQSAKKHSASLGGRHDDRWCDLPAGERRVFSRAAHGSGRRGAKRDRKSTRLNSSHGYISYAVFCLKKKKKPHTHLTNKPANTEEYLKRTNKNTHCIYHFSSNNENEYTLYICDCAIALQRMLAIQTR